MAKKPSPAELKKQGEELGKSLADVRKKQHNFAMQIGKEGIVFVIDRKKPADVLWRNAKKDGGGPKGAKGRVNMSGKIVEFDCDEPDTVPKNLLKLAKKHFAERGQPLRLILKGVEEDEGENEAEEDQVEDRKARTQEEEAPAAEEQSRSAAEEEAPAASSGASSSGDAEESSGGEAEAEPEAQEGSSGDDAVREALQKEFGELEDDLVAAEESDNKGVAKKVGGLKGMFETQIETDLKKARSVLTLLQTTIGTAKDAGDIAETTGGAGEQAAAERQSKLADLERGVDELLAQFAA